MKAAIGGIAVFALAVRAERKRRQAGLRPVVGQSARHRVARAAMGAGDEGVAPASPGGIEQLGQAVGADGGVVADGRGARWPPTAFGDGEVRAVPAAVTVAHRRRPRAPAAALRAQSFSRKSGDPLALGGDLHARGVVAHPAGQAELASPVARRCGRKPTPCTEAGDADAAGGDHVRAARVRWRRPLQPVGHALARGRRQRGSPRWPD